MRECENIIYIHILNLNFFLQNVIFLISIFVLFSSIHTELKKKIHNQGVVCNFWTVLKHKNTIMFADI